MVSIFICFTTGSLHRVFILKIDWILCSALWSQVQLLSKIDQTLICSGAQWRAASGTQSPSIVYVGQHHLCRLHRSQNALQTCPVESRVLAGISSSELLALYIIILWISLVPNPATVHFKLGYEQWSSQVQTFVPKPQKTQKCTTRNQTRPV